jgi:hypothetical protein
MKPEQYRFTRKLQFYMYCSSREENYNENNCIYIIYILIFIHNIQNNL